jgi:hypothetical protein
MDRRQFLSGTNVVRVLKSISGATEEQSNEQSVAWMTNFRGRSVDLLRDQRCAIFIENRFPDSSLEDWNRQSLYEVILKSFGDSTTQALVRRQRYITLPAFHSLPSSMGGLVWVDTYPGGSRDPAIIVVLIKEADRVINVWMSSDRLLYVEGKLPMLRLPRDLKPNLRRWLRLQVKRHGKHIEFCKYVAPNGVLSWTIPYSAFESLLRCFPSEG